MDKYADDKLIVQEVSITRDKVLAVAQGFKSSWRELATALSMVHNAHLYKGWGFNTFEDYTAKEIHIHKNTAMKLINSYRFLRAEEPRYFKQPESGEVPSKLPPLEAVDTLRRAKNSLDESQYKKIKNYVLRDECDISEAKKDLTSMIKERRRNNNGETERVKKDIATVKRFVLVLNAFKKEVELIHILPGTIVDDIDNLITSIEVNLARETDSAKLLK